MGLEEQSHNDRYQAVMIRVSRLAESVGDYRNPNSLGSRFRQRRSAPLRAMIEAVHATKGEVNILDVGGLEDYWTIMPPDYLRQHNVHIVLLNLAPDVIPPQQGDIFRTEVGDGCNLHYADDSFDICHSNSVIEHVCSWANKSRFAIEVRRVAPNLFIQTPAFWFPYEPHVGFPIFHWLPEPIRQWIALHRKLAWSPRANNVTEAMDILEHASLLNVHQMRYLFPDCHLIKERFCGMTKSYVAVRSA